MANYHTEQKKLLLDFLRENSGRSYTVEEICAGLGSAVGKSTVYRLMTRLVEEKMVHRTAGEGRQFLYRITADEHCKHHLHLQCTDCGRVLHLDEATSDALLDSVRAAGGFSVSEEDTVLLGRCAGCRVGKK